MSVDPVPVFLSRSKLFIDQAGVKTLDKQPSE